MDRFCHSEQMSNIITIYRCEIFDSSSWGPRMNNWHISAIKMLVSSFLCSCTCLLKKKIQTLWWLRESSYCTSLSNSWRRCVLWPATHSNLGVFCKLKKFVSERENQRLQRFLQLLSKQLASSAKISQLCCRLNMPLRSRAKLFV